MKRILGMVAALAGVLAVSSTARAVEITFDLSLTGTTWSRSTDAAAQAASEPGGSIWGGECTAGMFSPPLPIGQTNNCFRYGFQPGSSVTVDITGDVVTMIGGTIFLSTAANPTPLAGGTFNLTTILETTIYGQTENTPAAYGTLVGDSILWTTQANVSSTGTLMCTGSNCEPLGMPENFPMPFDDPDPPFPYPALLFSQLSATTGVTALNLGQWDLNAAHSAITGSTIAVTRWSIVEAYQGNARSGALTFGPNGLGQPVPEPGVAALVLLGLGALAVRSRKA
jgi:hypothetical protein